MFLYDKENAASNPFTASPFVRITQISHVPRPFPWTTYPHFHSHEFELAITLEGKGLLQLPGVSYPLSAGSLILIPPNMAHFYQSDGSSFSHFAIRFMDMENDSPVFRQLNSKQPLFVRFQQLDSIRSFVEIQEQFTKENGGLIDQKVQTLGLLILEMAQEELACSGVEIRTHVPEYAYELLQYLQNHIHSKVTLANISRHFSLSESHLSRVFYRTYHISPIHYLIYCRMRQARTYVLNENMPPAEIAKRLAYKTTYHFTKAFEKFYGCRPEEYRE